MSLKKQLLADSYVSTHSNVDVYRPASFDSDSRVVLPRSRTAGDI